MMSTLYFLLLLAFWLWYRASPQVKLQPVGSQEAYVIRHPQGARLAGWLLAGLAAAGFVLQLGWITGLCAWLVGLMGAGCLVVALAPFRYVGVGPVVALYGVFLLMELIF